MDLCGGGGQQFAQQVNSEKAGRPGEEHLSRPPPVRRRPKKPGGPADGINQFVFRPREQNPTRGSVPSALSLPARASCVAFEKPRKVASRHRHRVSGRT